MVMHLKKGGKTCRDIIKNDSTSLIHNPEIAHSSTIQLISSLSQATELLLWRRDVPGVRDMLDHYVTLLRLRQNVPAEIKGESDFWFYTNDPQYWNRQGGRGRAYRHEGGFGRFDIRADARWRGFGVERRGRGGFGVER